MKSVSAALIIHNKKILIGRRAKNVPYSGLYEFPGGKIEKNETPQECLYREIKEELDIESKIGDLFTVIKWEDKFLLKSYFTHIEEKDIPKMKLRVHDDFQWVNLNNYTKFKLLPADIEIMEQLKQNFFHLF
jgi:8-oxo-dGTP diphosphatase